MGLKGWYAFLRKKGYQPSVLYPSAASTTSSTATRRVDLLSRFSVIRNAYTRNSIEMAHTILELDVMRFGTKENIIIYVDGVQAEEKEFTAQIRQEARRRPLSNAKKVWMNYKDGSTTTSRFVSDTLPMPGPALRPPSIGPCPSVMHLSSICRTRGGTFSDARRKLML
ncbi:hypothetical protein BC939DRAFT_277412 [Gamsiella multidivaricata]|uniref:uncharacterized protein n=1 Tax=Gamsiella multidivaricata TaxID=101098 RepID=UPI0022200830|nr:uncharacterized protein BC939DRAFT_277412 [Gamsiella multidivaricata]KAI7818891.1 hypothetical protein BC939DRAFT_277412 [Gamsiella multidivaricata]